MANLPITNETVLAIIKETTEGQTPASPAFSTLRFRGESITETLNSETDEEIRSDRQYTDSVIVSGESGGEIQYNFIYGAQTDMLLMAALQTSAATWGTTESIHNEKTKHFFTIEKQVKDGAGTTNYFRFKGMQVGTMTMNFQDGLLGGAVTFLGLDGESDTAPIALATYGDADTGPLMNSADSVSSIVIKNAADADLGVTVQDMTLTLDNGLRGQRALGSLYHAGVASSRFKCEVSGNLYFKDRSIYDKFKANELLKLEITLTDSLGNAYQIVMNNCKTQSHEIVAGGVDQDMIASWTAMGFGDSQSPSRTITVTKTDA